MKKAQNLLIAALFVFSLLAVPVTVFAQEDPGIEEVEILDEEAGATTDPMAAEEDSLPETGAVPQGVDKTGFGPSDNAFLRTTLLFILGSAAGAGIGYGIVTLKKNRQS